MTTDFPPIFIINLKRHQKRRAFMLEQLQSLPFEYEFVEAVDGADLTEQEIADLCQNQPEKYIGRPLARGEIGCYLSHIKAMEMICQRNISEAIVLEDDVNISPDLAPFLSNRHKIPKQWGVLQLAKPTQGSNGVQFWSRCAVSIYRNYTVARPFPLFWGGQGYFVRQSFCQKAIGHAYPIIAPIDYRLFDIYCSIDFFYALNGEQWLFHNEDRFETSMDGRGELQKGEFRRRQETDIPRWNKAVLSLKHFIERILYFSKTEHLIAKCCAYYGRMGSHKTDHCCLEHRQRHSLSGRLLFLVKVYFGGYFGKSPPEQ